MQTNPKSTIPGRRLPIGILFFLSAATLLIENFLDYPLGIPRLRQLAGGRPLLDLRFGYTSDAVYELFEALGEPGRRAYLQLLWTVDVWLPLICALFLAEAIYRGRFRVFYWIPALVAVGDYAENTAITVLLQFYPTQMPALVLISSSLTLLKYIGYLIAILIAIGGYFTRNGSGERTADQKS